MKQVISVKDLEELLRSGKDPAALPGDALLTPSARDMLRDLENGAMRNGSVQRPGGTPAGTPTRPVNSKSSPADLAAFFNSPAIHDLKLQICDVGRRLWRGPRTRS